MEEAIGETERPLPLRDDSESTMGSPSPICSQAKCYMTDMVIECVTNAINLHRNEAEMKVELLNHETQRGETLLFEKMSSSEWKYDRIIELTDAIMFKARFDSMGSVGLVNIEKTDVKKFRSMTVSTETARDFLTERDDRPMFRLKFQVVGIPLDGNYQKEAFLNTMKKDSEVVFSAVQDLPDHTINKPMFLNACGIHFLKRFKKSQNKDDIDNCVLANKLALQLTVSKRTGHVHFSDNPGVSLIGGNQLITNLNTSDKDEPSVHPHLADRLNSLGVSLQYRFELTDDLTDITEAILLQREAVQLTFDGHPSMPTRLAELKDSLLERFARTQDLTDLSEATSVQQKAVQLTPEGHSELPTNLFGLANIFQHRYSITGELIYITEAISFQRKAVQLTPDGHSSMPTHLSGLGDSLQRLFNRTGNLADISEAISLQKNAVQLADISHPYMPIYLSGLGDSLQRRFDRTGELVDLSEAISMQQEAIHLTPEGHPYLPTRLFGLANALQNRFTRTGELVDLSESIKFLQKAVQTAPKDHPCIPIYFTALGNAFQQRFFRTGELADISEAISFQRKAVQLTPDGDPYMPVYLYNLGDALRRRFARTGEVTDISEAISFQQKVIELTPQDHPRIPLYLSGLGDSLQYRFSSTGEFTDISEAVSCLQKAIQLTPEGHPDVPIYLSGLGISLQHRFSSTGKYTDISEAVSFLQKAVQLTPEDHSAIHVYLALLADAFRDRFSHTGELADISEAISLLQKGIQLTPDGHAEIVRMLSSLALSLSSRFEYTRNITDIHTAISKLSLAANSNSGSPSVRLNAAKDWVRFSQKYDPSQLLDAHRAVIHLIPRVAGLEQTIEKRHNSLIDISTLSASAAAVAFGSEKTDLALEWLEQGRCLVWSQLNDLRTPLQTLSNHFPKIADEILTVSRALENAGSRKESSLSIGEASMLLKSSLQDEEVVHVKLAQQWDRLLATVRSIPDFEDFLKPPSSSTLLRNLPNSGITIVINVHQDRCDALALRTGIEPLHIALPEFSYSKADRLRKSLKNHLQVSGLRMRDSKAEVTRAALRHGSPTSLTQILSTLWICVAKPILNGLGYLASEPPSDLMRIWWCATGPLAFLPIHAAGIYDDSSAGMTSTLSDFAISSYTPTVRALVDIVRTPREVDMEKTGLFMISQPDTPGLPPILGTTDEVHRIERQLKPRGIRILCLNSAAATTDRSIVNMKAYSCIHLACHAEQDTKKPLKSGFCLYDGRLELSSIIQQRLVDADFAFLSACQTSAGDEKLSEEAVHLAAGMLAAGYRGAVATMWSIHDKYGPRIAEDFYSNLIQESEGLSGANAARALHYAMQNLRKSLGNSESALLSWVPYVHFGL